MRIFLLPLVAMTFPAHAAPPPPCVAAGMPACADVDTVVPLAPGETPGDVIILTGNVTDGRFAVSEHELPPSRPARPSMALPPPKRDDCDSFQTVVRTGEARTARQAERSPG